jgi:hypothetical protein
MIFQWNKERETAAGGEFIEVKFVPLPDITAYEMAHIFSMIAPGIGCMPSSGLRIRQEFWDALGPEMRRHFVTEVRS